MSFYFYITIAPVCFVTGNSIFKLWAVKEKWWLLLIALGFFLVGNLFIAHAIKLNSLVGTISLEMLGSLLLTLLIGFFYFGERLTTIQYFGIAFAVIAITLLVFPFQNFVK